MTKVVFVGDCHGDFQSLDKLLFKEEPFDFFLSVGDVGTLNDVTPANIHIVDFWSKKGYNVLGNHDDARFFSELDAVQNIGGLKVAALNGMIKTRSLIKKFRELMVLSHLKNVDILVTHQPPKGLYKSAGEQVLSDLLEFMAPQIHISGHIHQYKLKFYSNTFAINLPMINKGHAVATFNGKELTNLEIELNKGKKVIRI